MSKDILTNTELDHILDPLSTGAYNIVFFSYVQLREDAERWQQVKSIVARDNVTLGLAEYVGGEVLRILRESGNA